MFLVQGTFRVPSTVHVKFKLQTIVRRKTVVGQLMRSAAGHIEPGATGPVGGVGKNE